MPRRDYDMERAIELGTAHGAIKVALWLADAGMTERAIAGLREAFAILDEKYNARQKAILGE